MAALAALDELAKRDGERVDTLLLRGYIAVDRGEFDAAERYLAQATKLQALDVDWSAELESAKAELAETRGHLDGAELLYEDAISTITKLRANARTQSAYFVSSHRRPFDGLFALLARQGRWREALAVTLDLDATPVVQPDRDEQSGDDTSGSSATRAVPSGR